MMRFSLSADQGDLYVWWGGVHPIILTVSTELAGPPAAPREF